ncbi:hypothetical protein PM10SUCC1_33210 [Propionigenium maris DSM 9537]|uniref:Uncharacterized protein n=1 Tax=Propionigenium maris DSM 9537 TaxID=1123000 RepID=A0A9W6GPY9_9FUSO|nr:hypothetical protein [Propionigenium maris]GLI57807.1 hypothetical protein PM10SUCC1_33210 [Propionigenium maris DSM 9537]
MKKILSILFLLMTLTAFGSPILPQNSNIMVKMDSTIDSNSAFDGQIFTGTLQSNMTLQNGEVVPAGSKIFGRVIASNSAGNISGSSKLAITLTEMQVDGFNYGINTTAIGFEGENQAASTVRTATRTAAVGGLFNKARGSSGSQGLKVGGALGAGAGILSNNGAIAIRAGEILQFRTTTAVVVG